MKKRASACLAACLAVGVLFGGCGADKQPSATIQAPGWTRGPYVGIARKTASGSKNEQRMLALQRAIAELLISSGEATGQSVVSVAQSLQIQDTTESYTDDYQQHATIKATFKNKTYDIEQVNWWENSRTGEYYVQIKEK